MVDFGVLKAFAVDSFMKCAQPTLDMQLRKIILAAIDADMKCAQAAYQRDNVYFLNRDNPATHAPRQT